MCTSQGKAAEGDTRIDALCECSGAQTRPKPRSSSARATSIGDIVRGRST